jgi:hypothetical protein
LRQRDLTNDEKNKSSKRSATLGDVEEVQYNSVGPIIGAGAFPKRLDRYRSRYYLHHSFYCVCISRRLQTGAIMEVRHCRDHHAYA